MPKPACVPCKRFFRPERNGQRVLENMPVGTASNSPPGLAAPEKWKPYKLWMADRWRCHGCGTEIVTGFAASPIAEHYETGFKEEVASSLDLVEVNDC